MKQNLVNTILVAIGIISAFMHFEHFSKDLVSIHVWRQTQTQSTIDNFYEEDMNILNPRRNDRGNTEGIFRMEFPLMQWLVAVQYKIFGNHLIISRIFMFVIGLFSVLGIYRLLMALFNNSTLAIMGAWALNFSPSFYYYTINPLPDNLALCFSIWGLALFFNWYNHKKLSTLILSSLFLSMGALCKLPFIVFFIVPAFYFANSIYRQRFNRKLFIEIACGMLLVILPLAWYISVVNNWEGNPIVKGMFDNKESFSKLLFYYQHNLFSTLPELLLNYGSLLFFVAGFYFLIKNKSYNDSKFWPILSLCIAVLAYYFYESNAIADIHDYYLFPFFPLLFMLVAYGAFNIYKSEFKFAKILTILLLLLLPFTCYLRMKSRWNTESPGFNKDLLIYKSELRNAVAKDALVIAGNDDSHFIFLYYIDKKGWGFHNDEINPEKLKVLIEQGAEYLYTDAEKVIKDTAMSPYLNKLVLEKGSIKVYSLK